MGLKALFGGNKDKQERVLAQLRSLQQRSWSLLRSSKEEQEREEREREEQLGLANRLSQILVSSSNLGEVCRRFASELKDLMSIDWAAIALIDENTGAVRLLPLSANLNSPWESGDVLPLVSSPVAWVAENKRAMVASYSQVGMSSVVYMPLFSRREVFGSLIVGSRRPQAYGERELMLLKYTTTQLAMAIESFRTYRVAVAVDSLRTDRESVTGAEWQADLMAAIKHELKTPLTPILSGSELLREELDKESAGPQAKLAESVARSAQTLNRKLNELLQLATVQAPDFRLKLVKLDISSVLKDAAAQIAEQLEDKGQSLELVLSTPAPMIMGDKEYLMQMLLALLTTASELSPEGSKIGLQLIIADGELVVAVRDSGPGFSKQDQREVMAPYSFVEADRQPFPGLRLRLTTVKQLAHRHGGRLWLESEPGKGSTFSFSVPVAWD